MHVYAFKRSRTRLSPRVPRLIYQGRPLSFVPSLPPHLVQTSSTFIPHQSPYDTPIPSFPRPPALSTMSAQIMPSATASAGNDPEKPWHAAYPEASSKPTSISCDEVLCLLKEGNDGAKLVLVDLRRTDYEVRQKQILVRSLFD